MVFPMIGLDLFPSAARRRSPACIPSVSQVLGEVTTGQVTIGQVTGQVTGKVPGEEADQGTEPIIGRVWDADRWLAVGAGSL